MSGSCLQLKAFLSAIVNTLIVDKDHAHVALQLYNDQSVTVFNLNTYSETADATAAILRTTFSRVPKPALIDS